MAWRIAGTYVGSCSCDVICPCPVDAPPNNPDGGTECTGAGVFHIAEGSLDDVDLSNVNFAFYNYWPSNLTAGNWKVGVVVDDAASDEQTQALNRILSGQEGGTFGELAQLMTEFLGTERGTVSFSDGETPTGAVVAYRWGCITGCFASGVAGVSCWSCSPSELRIWCGWRWSLQ